MRQAADELRAELAGDTVTFVVNRNLNVSNVCIVGCAFCGFGQGALARRLRARPRGVRRARARGASPTARPRSACSRASTRTGRSRTTSAGCAGQGDGAAAAPARVQPMEVAHMCDVSGLPPGEVFARLRDAGLGSVRARRAEVLDDGVRAAHLAQQAAGRALGGDHRGRARGRPALDRDRDVRAHRGAWRAGRAHARRAGAAGAHGRLHGVRAAVVHPVPHAARAARTDRGDLPRGEPQAHGGVPARARRTVPTCRRAG
jgi:hypothetical protein